MMEAMKRTGYRLQMSVLARMLRVVLQVVLGFLFVPGLIDPVSPLLVRLGYLLGVGLAIYGLRVVLGPAVVVGVEGLRIYTIWPKHRDLAWYRVFAVDIVPGRWLLELELNSGERITLPVVERVDALYEQIEELRQHLDA
jgi:hypothetical protein